MKNDNRFQSLPFEKKSETMILYEILFIMIFIVFTMGASEKCASWLRIPKALLWLNFELQKLLLFHSDVGIRVVDNINLIWMSRNEISFSPCWIELIRSHSNLDSDQTWTSLMFRIKLKVSYFDIAKTIILVLNFNIKRSRRKKL